MKRLLLIILMFISLVSLGQYVDNKPRFDQFKPMPLMAEVKGITPTGGFQIAHAMAVFGNYMYVGERIDNAQSASIARIIKYDINTMTELAAYEVGANLDVESMAYDSINGRIYATRYNTSQLEIMSINPITMTLDGSVHLYSGIIAGASPAICTDGTYIYGVTYTDPTTIFKIRLSDWVVVQTTVWTGRERGHAVKINTRTGQMFATTIPSSSATNPYFIKIDLATLIGTEVNIGAYVKKATDDFAMIDTGSEVYCFVGGEYSVVNYGGVRIKVSDLSLTGFALKNTYGLDSYGNNVYSCAVDGTLQLFNRFTPENMWTYKTNGYFLNEIIVDKSGRILCTNFDAYNEARGLVIEFALLNSSSTNTNSSLSPVTSVFGRAGAVVAVNGDYNASQVTNAAAINVANTFTQNQTISKSSSPYFEIFNTGAATTGGGFRITDDVGLQRLTLGYNNNLDEAYYYGQYDNPFKILLNNAEQFRFKTDGVFETRNLAADPSASRSGFGGFYAKNNIPYFINSSGTVTQLGGTGGSMVYPSGSGIPLVSGGVAWGATIALNGNTGQFLNGNGAFATPTFSSQWTTSGSDIYYSTGNVSVGTTPSSSAKFISYGDLAGGNSGYFNNISATGSGVNSLIATASDAYYGFKVRAAATDRMYLTGAGTIQLIQQASSPSALAGFGSVYAKIDGKLYYKNSSGTETDLTLGGSGGGSGTVTSVELAMPSIFTVSGSPVTVSGTLTASLNNQSANTVFASDGGTPYFRALAGADLPLATNVARGGIQIGYSASGVTLPLLLNVEKGYIALTRTAIEAAYPITPSQTPALDTGSYSNLRHTTSGSINVNINNLVEGRTGNIEITYTGAAVITFIVNSGYTLLIASNIYNSTTNAYTKSVLSKSSGTAVYSYYMSGTNVYLTGTQSWN